MAMSAEVGAAAANSLRSFADDGSPKRARKCPMYQESRRSSALADDIVRANLLSTKLARYWKGFVRSGKTTLALAQAYDSLGINESSVKHMPFETLTTSLVSPAVLQTATALLDRLERRLAISHSSVENVDHLLKHANNTAPRSMAPSNRPSSKRGAAAAKRSPAPAAAASSGTATTTSRYSPRVALSAYMIVAHPGTVLSGGRGVGEAELMESAAIFVRELELLTRMVLEGPAGRGRFGAQLADFDRAWCAYLYRFVAWKVKDTRVLEKDLVTMACKLELSMLQACKVTADGKAPGDLTHDMQAIRQQVANDQELLRGKVRQVSGGAGVERMETAISEARSKFFESKKAEMPVADASGAPPNIDSSAAAGSSSSSESPAKKVTEREKIVNEMLHLGVGDGFGATTDTADQKDFKNRVKEIMNNAFWDQLTDSMTRDKPDYTHLISLVKEVRDMLHEVEPRQLMKEEIVEKIDLETLSQLLGSGSRDQSAQYMGQILEYSLDTVRKLSDVDKVDEMKKRHGKLLSELAASSEVDDNGVSSFATAVVKGLRFVHEEIRELRDEVSVYRFKIAVQPIVSGYAGVEYMQKAFACRYGPPADASASLPLTLRWISASKSVAQQEWSEHVETLQSAGQAPAIVPVLRAGQGAPVAQPCPSPAASADSGQPECNGEKLDKLVRMGLLQLVSGIEGCKVETTPESFHINLPRLRAVQSQFQKVIGISTSMLILRQVLTAEKSKATPAEVENAVAELYKDLVRMLDSSPDAGTGEMVAAMVRASASVGSPSEERMQTRTQVIARVFVKSVQPDDVVFKMVHRAVHRAFRGVVLGGSGAKGKKLADAALRRVGAAKLVDRVVKAAEVVIKVATVSEKVHGPWYTALMSL